VGGGGGEEKSSENKGWIKTVFPPRILISAGPCSSRGAEREAARHQSGGRTGGARGGEGSSVGPCWRGGGRQSENVEGGKFCFSFSRSLPQLFGLAKKRSTPTDQSPSAVELSPPHADPASPRERSNTPNRIERGGEATKSLSSKREKKPNLLSWPPPPSPAAAEKQREKRARKGKERKARCQQSSPAFPRRAEEKIPALPATNEASPRASPIARKRESNSKREQGTRDARRSKGRSAASPANDDGEKKKKKKTSLLLLRLQQRNKKNTHLLARA